MSCQPLHATLIARHSPGGWRGVLLRGASGAGKSSLALRAASLGFRLVADDRVIVWRSGATLFGRAPDTLAGLIEVRGVGVGPSPGPLRLSPIHLLADLVADPREVERTPEPEHVELFGAVLPLVRFAPFEASAADALAVALAAVQRPL